MRIRSILLALFVLVLPASRTAAQGSWPGKDWPTASPASVGLDARALAEFDAEIAAGKFGYVDSMLVIRDGKIAYDRSYPRDYDTIYGRQARERSALNAHDPSGPYNYFNPWWHPYYRRGDLHSIQSVTKTVSSVVIGAAMARNEFPSVETPILTFFDEAKVANADERKRRITIRHLLTMTAGIEWHEDLPYSDPKNSASVMEASFDWVRYAIDQPMQHEPGAVYHYSSGSSQLLSHIFHRATGLDIEEYAARRVFGPLGIERFYWKRTPTGLPDTEGGLYLRAHDLARIAYLYLRGGVWGGRQIVSPEWVRASVAPAMTVSATSGVKYGYKWWLYPYGDDGRLAWAGSGFGGQLPIIVPEYDLVLVFTGWNIAGGKAGLSHRTAIERILRAVTSRRAPAGASRKAGGGK